MDAGAIAVGIIAIIDAAYSGDWSRIGFINKEVEAQLQSFLVALGGWHLVMGMSA